jgi:hypothetical protein
MASPPGQIDTEPELIVMESPDARIALPAAYTNTIPMAFVRYFLTPEMVQCYYRAFHKLQLTLHSEYRTSFKTVFHLYQGPRTFEKVRWLNNYLDRFEYDLWDITDLIKEVRVMLECLGFHLIFDSVQSQYVYKQFKLLN